MTRKRILLLVALALLCSVLMVGGRLKREAVSALIGLLDEEAATSCGGSIVYDSAKLSLMTLSVEARNVRLLVEGTPHLSVERLRGRFGLRDIFSKKIHIDHLELIGTHAAGVGEESGTYRFIDHLTAPIPPEKDRPGRWRVSLERLSVVDGSFIEQFRSSELHGEGVSLEVIHTPDDNFQLLPAARELKVRYPRPTLEHTFIIGGLRSDLTIESHRAVFNQISLLHKESELLISAISDTKNRNALSGSGTATLHAESLGITPPIAGTVSGTTILSGNLGSPKIEGALKAIPPFTIAPAGVPLFVFDETSGRFIVDVNRGDPIVSLVDVQAKSATAQVKDGSFTLYRDTIKGGATLHLDSITSDVVSVRDATVTLALSGTLDTPTIGLKLEAGHGHILDYDAGATAATGTFSDRSLAFSLSTTEGTLSGKGLLNLSENEIPSLANLQLQANRLRLKDTRASSIVDDLLIDGGLSLEGPLTASLIRGKGTVAASYLPLSGRWPIPNIVKGTVTLGDGVIALTGADETGRATTKARVIIDGKGPSSLTLAFAAFTPPIEPAEQVCLSVSATTSYSFGLDNPLLGDGSLALSDLRVGCPPYQLQLPRGTKLAIKRGRALVDTLSLSGNGSSVTAGGWVSLAEGYATNLSGGLRLESLLDLFPAIDNASGLFSGSVRVSGPIAAPEFRGSLSLSEGRVFAGAAGIEANALAGKGDIAGNKITISELSGTLNRGAINASGLIDIVDLSRSQIKANLTGTQFDSIPHLTAIADGQITLGWSPELTPQLGGNIQLQSGSFERSLDLGTVAKFISDALIGTREGTELGAASKKGGAELNLNITGEHELFLGTNWAEAELKANLVIAGSTSSPRITGELEALSGWFGFRDTRFSIVSGSVRFNPDNAIPSIDIIGQSTILSASGESNSILLEARGAADNPKIVLSSDRGLSQREIIALLTGGGGRTDVSRQSSTSRFGLALNYNDLSLFDNDSPTVGTSLLSRLTHIDSLTVEPAYNNTTGSIDPAVIATKKLTERLSLNGEGLFSGAASESRARLDYQIFDSLNATGTLVSNSLRQGTQLGVDLAFTIKSRERVPLTITFIGNDALQNSEILRYAKIKRSRPLRAPQLRSLVRRITTAYTDRGYRDAAVAARCVRQEDPCTAVDIFIDEGTMHDIGDIVLEGQNIEGLLPESLLRKLKKRARATKSFEQLARITITRHLRESGYLASRVETLYQLEGNGIDKQSLLVRIDQGPKYKFIFSGNTRFSDDELLERTELINRSLPFGNNSIAVLVEKMAERYRRAGYLNATVSYQLQTEVVPETQSTGQESVTYLITISEGMELPVKRVSFVGNQQVATSTLKKELTKQQKSAAKPNILSPRYAVDEELQSHSTLIEGLYQNLGFSGTRVSYEIVPVSKNRVEIHYIIQEGVRSSVKISSISGIPLGVLTAQLPTKSINAVEANKLISNIAQNLRDAGYQSSSIILIRSSTEDSYTIDVTSGTPVTLARISVEGAISVPTTTILNTLKLREGDPWSQTLLEEGRRKLLKLGLFSSVIFSDSSSANPTQRELTIKVIERPLSYLRFGGGANSQFGAHIFGEASDRSLFLDGREVSLRADLYVLPGTLEVSQGIASILYAIPSVLDSPYSFVEDLRFQKLSTTTQEFDVERSIVSSYLYRSDSSGIGLTFGHSLARENIFNVPQDVQIGRFDSGTVLLSTLNSSITLDKRDAPLMPTSGYTLGFDGSLASNALGSDASYLSGTMRASTILPLFSPASNWSLAASTRWAASQPLGDTDEIPITQRYYLGGRNSIRGFRENSLGPLSEGGNVIGGDLLAASSAQLQYRIAERVSLHTFLDIGNVFLKSQHDSLTNQRKGYGLGLRFISPIGPIGFDLGFPTSPQEGEPKMRFHFSVGSNY